jgi:hypothetical protein
MTVLLGIGRALAGERPGIPGLAMILMIERTVAHPGGVPVVRIERCIRYARACTAKKAGAISLDVVSILSESIRTTVNWFLSDDESLRAPEEPIPTLPEPLLNWQEPSSPAWYGVVRVGSRLIRRGELV